MEKVVGPMSYNHSIIYINKLIRDSKAFIGGSKPIIGRLKSSYGYKKVIGIMSFDHQVRLRIDYDPFKGYHFNYENFHTGEKICVLIGDMSRIQYERYIDTQTKGRCPITTPKMPNISDMSISKKPSKLKKLDESIVIKKLVNELNQDKFVVDYYNGLLYLGDNYEIELSDDEIDIISDKKDILKNKIIKNIDFLEEYCSSIDIEININYLYKEFLDDDSYNNHFTR